MTYKLKGGEEIRDGKLYGWTGHKCSECGGVGQAYNRLVDHDTACRACGGTGEHWGLMPTQPADLQLVEETAVKTLPSTKPATAGQPEGK